MSLLKEGQSGRRWQAVILAGLAGVALTVGAGLAMVTTDTAGFCGGCHAMSEAVLTHSQSVHSKLSCNDCHAPHNIVAKIPFKAAAGTRDIYVNTLGTVPDLIHPVGNTLEVVQANCVRCHTSTVMTVNMDNKESCMSCHRHVPHTPRKPISTRKAADV
ncbi:cytochrome c3 family protein [Desulfovibrio psychrotolerans]|uniref:Cytochrome c-type protein n=1 Tax=Desulfovibrio psychrotolerans TaxID=415242 RepID=A0A7J0BP96_9BACT|nr:NapC/NirT family cytochrome c [Desulfovibrio psychrotolerans]GFM35517.1 cytochrome c-type protein [Desulfovibrio psychrotolerans]